MPRASCSEENLGAKPLSDLPVAGGGNPPNRTPNAVPVRLPPSWAPRALAPPRPCSFRQASCPLPKQGPRGRHPGRTRRGSRPPPTLSESSRGPGEPRAGAPPLDASPRSGARASPFWGRERALWPRLQQGPSSGSCFLIVVGTGPCHL